MLKPQIIAVSGGSGSGKTTIVKRLCAQCDDRDILVLGLDHYYKDLSHLTPSERDLRNFDHPDAFDMGLLRVHLLALRAGQTVERPTYDFTTHSRTQETQTLSPKPAIVIDGILALHDHMLRKLYDLAIYVDVSDDVRFIRRLQRDIQERGRNVEGVIHQYLASVKPMHDLYVAPQKQVADIIVSWEDYNERAVAMMADMLRQWTKNGPV